MNTVIEILIDLSGSMGYMKGTKSENEFLLKDGSTRTDLVKKMLNQEILPTIDYVNKIAVRTFRQNGEQLEIKSVYDGLFDIDKIKVAINSIGNPPPGGTPISAALENSIEVLKKFENNDRKIILLTDGEENGDGNYIEVAKKAMALHGIPCKLFIVGIDQNESAKNKAEKLAEVTNGSYLNVNAFDYNKEFVKKVLLPLKSQVIKSSLENLTSDVLNSKIEHTKKSSSIISNQPVSELKELKSEQQNIKTDTQTSKDNLKKEANEETIDKLPNKEMDNLKEIVGKNSMALNLITKQLDNLTQEISALKGNFDNYESQEEVIVPENKELNEKVRDVSERFLYEILKQKYSERLKWLNEKGESGANHDFEVLEDDSSIEYYIECKATKNTEKFFYMTKNEWELFINNTKNYQIYFIINALNSPSYIKIDNLLDWILKGKIYPMSNSNKKVKAERIMMTILE